MVVCLTHPTCLFWNQNPWFMLWLKHLSTRTSSMNPSQSYARHRTIPAEPARTLQRTAPVQWRVPWDNRKVWYCFESAFVLLFLLFLLFALFLLSSLLLLFSEQICTSSQWLLLVPLIGGRWYIITQLTVYTTYIPLIYCQSGDYMLPTNQGLPHLHL